MRTGRVLSGSANYESALNVVKIEYHTSISIYHCWHIYDNTYINYVSYVCDSASGEDVAEPSETVVAYIFGGLVRTLSTRPKSWASAGLIKWSRSMCCSIFANAKPVCFT